MLMLRVLLDTHAFLWWALDDHRLSARARDAIAAPENEVLVSAAAAWELAIKASLGRLELAVDLRDFVADEMRRSSFLPLPVDLRHALAVRDLPAHHRDPFDRLLIAQAIHEDLVLISADPLVARYPVQILW